jgi:hypothetical protein
MARLRAETSRLPRGTMQLPTLRGNGFWTPETEGPEPPLRSSFFPTETASAVLAETAMRLWPVWFTDVSFAMCCDDALGRQAAGVIAREAAARAPGVSSPWAEAAARLALAGGLPRVAGVPPAIELAQLSLAISRVGPASSLCRKKHRVRGGSGPSVFGGQKTVNRGQIPWDFIDLREHAQTITEIHGR